MMLLKVMTFNIHQGRGTDKKLDLKRIGHVIKAADADIISLNEVDKHFARRSDFADQAQFLADELNMEYVYGPAVTIKTPGGRDRQFGNALLTRFPIVKSQNHPFDFLPNFAEDRALLEVRMKIEEQEITAFVTHLSLATFLHRKQSEFILQKIEDTAGPSFVMGDWNMSPLSRTWRRMTQRLKDAWVESHPQQKGGHTFPSNYPLRRLDYIFISKHFEAVEIEVVTINPEASDHLPVLGTLKLHSV
ncbi:endonuclease/exonuclease/phosphatase family protein [Ectobacillus panaciterrae]|uniref:endonuclease/exonuclease/phosphatase family protein n=1 Tax=Ectobacillus panaciterrae TaxID=363872 RepID=UPI00040A701A|nr:endonuclease/exonuclease/phosphatase family protein [Ectobacillus panaciterrae]